MLYERSARMVVVRTCKEEKANTIGGRAVHVI